MRRLILGFFVVVAFPLVDARAEAIHILAFGDSLTAGYGLPAEHGFTTRLEARLRASGHAVRVENAGVSGDTSAGGLARLGWALAGKPAAVILELGANDGLRGIEPSETRRNLEMILEKLNARGLPVLLAGMLAPPNMGREYGDEFKAVYHGLADRFPVLFYPFFLDGVAGRPELNQVDGMHPTLEGVEVIVDRILPTVEALIHQARGQ